MQMRIRSVMSNISVMNVLLFAAIIALAAYVLPPVLGMQAFFALPVAKKASREKEEKPPVAPPPSLMEYAVIAEQNVFNPERKIPAEKKEEQPLPRPDFVVYGTLVAGETSMAFMEDLKAPYTTAGRGKRQRTLRVGSALSGYTLSQVYTDRVVMVRGEDSIEVRVMDAHKKSGGANAAAAGQPPAQRSPVTQTAPQRIPGIKPQGTGLPPGAVKSEPPPSGTPAPDEKAMRGVKEKFDALIQEKLGRPTEGKE
jgi:hypothetical protein